MPLHRKATMLNRALPGVVEWYMSPPAFSSGVVSMTLAPAQDLATCPSEFVVDPVTMTLLQMLQVDDLLSHFTLHVPTDWIEAVHRSMLQGASSEATTRLLCWYAEWEHVLFTPAHVVNSPQRTNEITTNVAFQWAHQAGIPLLVSEEAVAHEAVGQGVTALGLTSLLEHARQEGWIDTERLDHLYFKLFAAGCSNILLSSGTVLAAARHANWHPHHPLMARIIQMPVLARSLDGAAWSSFGSWLAAWDREAPNRNIASVVRRELARSVCSVLDSRHAFAMFVHGIFQEMPDRDEDLIAMLTVVAPVQVDQARRIIEQEWDKSRK